MRHAFTLIALSFLAIAYGQQAGTLTAEVHPQLPAQQCTKSGCTTLNTAVVLDSNWRWLHNVGGSTNCYTGNEWDQSLCPDPVTCAQNCALDGADYSGMCPLFLLHCTGYSAHHSTAHRHLRYHHER